MAVLLLLQVRCLACWAPTELERRECCRVLLLGSVVLTLCPCPFSHRTTLSIVSGSLNQTKGSATVAGFDTSTQMDLVHRQMGMCPQFDCVFDDLTVADHLAFYGR